MTKLEIINETVEYYSKHPRGLMEVEECLLPAYFTPSGKMCAVGRCINPEMKEAFMYDIRESKALEEKDKDSAVWMVSVSDIPGIDKFLREEYRGHGIGFWEDIQHLHDSDRHWEGYDLNENGIEYVEHIKKKYK